MIRKTIPSLIAIGLVSHASAATISITTADGLGADTHLRSDVAANLGFNYGSATSMLLGSNAGNSPNGLINLLLRFDLAGLQTAAGGQSVTINSVTLTLTTATAGGSGGGLPFTVGIHDYAGNFVEGTANGTAQSGSSTWNDPMGNGSDTTLGGTAGTQLQTLSITSVAASTTWVFSSSSGLVSDLQGAYTTSGASVVNYLLTETNTGGDWNTDQTFIRVLSGENASSRPTLTIDYTVVPEPTTALLGSLSLLGMLRRRR